VCGADQLGQQLDPSFDVGHGEGGIPEDEAVAVRTRGIRGAGDVVQLSVRIAWVTGGISAVALAGVAGFWLAGL
jgi:hypothetical protein